MKDPAEDDVMRYGEMFSAIGGETRLRIMRLPRPAHADGFAVGEIQAELGMPASTLSHHLEKLKSEYLVGVWREGAYPRYAANAVAPGEVPPFL